MSMNKETGTAANYYVSQLYHEAVRYNLDINTMLAQTGISPASIDKPSERIGAEKLSALQLLIWQALDDECMGLATDAVKVGTYNMMGRITVHQPDLQKAFELGSKFYDLVTNAYKIRLEVDDDSAFLGFDLLEPEKDPNFMLSEILILAWHRYGSWLIADHLPLVETHFNYPRPSHVTEYSYLFPGIHIFNSDKLGFVFPKAYLQRTVEQNEASLKLFMRRCPLELFQRYQSDYSLASELKKLIRKSLEQGALSIEGAAEALNMSKRTLMRKIKVEGTSYQQLKDIVRRDEAITQLTKSLTPVNQISEAIGFSEPAVFSRAFHHWTGQSPAKYRETHKKPTQPAKPKKSAKSIAK